MEVNTGRLLDLQKDQFYSVVSTRSTNNLFAGTSGDGLYRSMDYSMSWEKSDIGINNAMVTSVSPFPNQRF